MNMTSMLQQRGVLVFAKTRQDSSRRQRAGTATVQHEDRQETRTCVETEIMNGSREQSVIEVEKNSDQTSLYFAAVQASDTPKVPRAQ